MGCLEILHFLQLGGMVETSLVLELHCGLQMPCVSQLKREQNESIFIKNSNSMKFNLQIQNLNLKLTLSQFKYTILDHNLPYMTSAPSLKRITCNMI
jgi:hypothetical protein